MNPLSRLTILLAFFAGCAQPSAVATDGGGFVRRDGGQLQFEEDGGSGFNPPDLAGRDLANGSLPDLATAAQGDLAIPVGADLAGVDFATPVDMAHATVENCFNDIDDDGNGKVNDGCPDTISVGADVALTAAGGSGGGVQMAHCPANQVVVAQRMFGDDYDEWMSGVGIWCSPVTLVRGTSSYSVQLTGPAGQAAGIFYGTKTDYQEDDGCDTTQFMVVWNNRIDASTYVNGWHFDCGKGTLALSPTNQLSITFSNNNDNWGWTYLGGTRVTDTCGPSQAVVGYNGRIGSWMDQIQPICAPLVVNYK